MDMHGAGGVMCISPPPPRLLAVTMHVAHTDLQEMPQAWPHPLGGRCRLFIALHPPPSLPMPGTLADPTDLQEIPQAWPRPVGGRRRLIVLHTLFDIAAASFFFYDAVCAPGLCREVRKEGVRTSEGGWVTSLTVKSNTSEDDDNGWARATMQDDAPAYLAGGEQGPRS